VGAASIRECPGCSCCSGATAGVRPESVYAVRNGEEQILGRYDMLEPSLYVSRQQCIVQVAVDGTAVLVSTGKPWTLYRPGREPYVKDMGLLVWAGRDGRPWYGMRRSRPLGDDIGFSGTIALEDGDEISLDMRNPESAVFTIKLFDVTGSDEARAMGGYDTQLSDDGHWMWNGAEWVPNGFTR